MTKKKDPFNTPDTTNTDHEDNFIITDKEIDSWHDSGNTIPHEKESDEKRVRHV